MYQNNTDIVSLKFNSLK